MKKNENVKQLILALNEDRGVSQPYTAPAEIFFDMLRQRVLLPPRQEAVAIPALDEVNLTCDISSGSGYELIRAEITPTDAEGNVIGDTTILDKTLDSIKYQETLKGLLDPVYSQPGVYHLHLHDRLAVITPGVDKPDEIEFTPRVWQSICDAFKKRNTRLAPNYDWTNKKRGASPAGATIETPVQEPIPGIVAPSLSPSRTGTRTQTRAAKEIRLPTAAPMRGVVQSLNVSPKTNIWTVTAAGDAISYASGDTQIRVECDDETFPAETAIPTIARMGSATAQTLLALIGLWLEHRRGNHYETYLSIRVTDLLRYMGRKEKGDGGYATDEIMAKGAEVALIDRLTVPRTAITKRNKETVVIGRLLMIQPIEIQQGSQIEFRYHLSKDLHSWVGGDDPQYRTVPGKILHYHPERQKYHILLGFCLAYYDRVNDRHKKEDRRISVGALLKMAGLEIPSRNVPDFQQAINRAILELAEDAVIPGALFVSPSNASYSARQALEESFITFPRMVEKMQTNMAKELLN